MLVRIANVMERDEARRTNIYFLEQRASSTSKPDEASGMAFTPALESAVDEEADMELARRASISKLVDAVDLDLAHRNALTVLAARRAEGKALADLNRTPEDQG